MAESRPASPARPVGPGRVLTLAYGFFTLAAGARSLVQLLTHPHRAMLAYSLSAGAAVIYALGTVLIALADRGRAHGLASLVCRVEIAGVLGVGLTSLFVPRWFPDASVWSGFGSGYGYVPAVLPLLALAWLHRPSPGRRGPQASRAESSVTSSTSASTLATYASGSALRSRPPADM